jgi:hypothetical protein
MINWFLRIWLVGQLICRRIEMDPEYLLLAWKNQPVIEIYDPSPAVRKAHFAAQLDTVFPF